MSTGADMKYYFARLSIALALLLLFGCSKINQENYDKLEIGMAFTEVTDILGSADECESILGGKSCIWGKEQKCIKIKFVADKVVFFSSKGL